MTSRGRAITVDDDGALDEAGVAAIVRRLVRVIGEYVQERRWYDEKARVVESWSVAEVAPIRAGESWFALTIVAAAFADAADEGRYFLPLAIVPKRASSASVLTDLDTAAGAWQVVDALTLPEFARWWLGRVAAGAEVAGGGGSFRWQALPGLAARLPAALAGEVRVGSVEQSNSSVRFDDAVFLKVFRRLRAGINPDEEVGRFLATQTPFRRLPVPLGSASYAADDGTTYPLALIQSFAASIGDGWEFTLDRLARVVHDGARVDVASPASAEMGLPSYGDVARLLGERTGELHIALTTDVGDPAFTPEQITPDDADEWEAAVLSRLRAAAADLRQRALDLSPPLRRRIAVLEESVPRLERQAAGFRAQVGGAKTRVHGDYHLGQVLRTPDDDWLILDFEGEPARSIEERRAKTSPLKDVAGMLRSFGYARGAALRAAGEVGQAPEVERLLRRWESQARTAFLAGYQTVVGQRPGLVPEGEAFEAATNAWELDKALYEIGYELSNRPEWLDLPLDALLRGDVATDE